MSTSSLVNHGLLGNTTLNKTMVNGFRKTFINIVHGFTGFINYKWFHDFPLFVHRFFVRPPLSWLPRYHGRQQGEDGVPHAEELQVGKEPTEVRILPW